MPFRGRVEDVAMRQRRPATGRVNLQEGTQKARLQILPKVKVNATEVRKAKESNGKKSSEFARKKEGKKGESTDQGTKDD